MSDVKVELVEDETIETKVITEKIAQLEKEKLQMMANLNANAGAIAVLNQLIKE